jgi:hypothetical protein
MPWFDKLTTNGSKPLVMSLSKGGAWFDGLTTNGLGQPAVTADRPCHFCPARLELVEGRD